ncbi:MAG: hypothetical protein ACLRMZ_02385 [Blautia marasmi]
MKRDTSYVIKRAEHFKSILTAEGFLVGIVADLWSFCTGYCWSTRAGA